MRMMYDGIEYDGPKITVRMDLLKKIIGVDKKVFPEGVIRDVEQAFGECPGVDVPLMHWQYKPSRMIYWIASPVYRDEKLYGLRFDDTPVVREALGLPETAQSGSVVSAEAATEAGRQVVEASCASPVDVSDAIGGTD